MGKKKKEKQKSASDKIRAYLKAEWQGKKWGLDDLARHLFADFEDVSGTVREVYRRSTMNAFSVARAKLADLDRELVIAKEYYKGTSGRVATWAFATNSAEDAEIIKALVDKKNGRIERSQVKFADLNKLIVEKGWLSNQKPVNA